MLASIRPPAVTLFLPAEAHPLDRPGQAAVQAGRRPFLPVVSVGPCPPRRSLNPGWLGTTAPGMCPGPCVSRRERLVGWYFCRDQAGRPGWRSKTRSQALGFCLEWRADGRGRAQLETLAPS